MDMKRKERSGYSGGEGGAQKRGRAPSIQVGNEFDVTIENLGHKGDGMVKIEGFTVFVKNTEVGEKVKIKINKVLETVAWGTRLN